MMVSNFWNHEYAGLPLIALLSVLVLVKVYLYLMLGDDGSNIPFDTKSNCINWPGPKDAPLTGAATISVFVHSGNAGKLGA